MRNIRIQVNSEDNKSQGALEEEASQKTSDTETKQEKSEQEKEESKAEAKEKTENKKYSTTTEWLEALQPEETILFVWNNGTGEHILIEEGMEYQMKKGDLFYIYDANGIDDYKVAPDKVEMGKLTSEIEFTEPITLFLMVRTGKKDITITMQVAGETVQRNFTLVAEDKEESAVTEEKQELNINTDSDELSESWIESLGTEIEVPFIVIVNDVTGSKTLLDEAEEYQVQEGDKLFLYIPQGLLCTTRNGDDGIFKNTEFKENGVTWEFDRRIMDIFMDDKVTVEFIVQDIMSGGKSFSVSCTLKKQDKDKVQQ